MLTVGYRAAAGRKIVEKLSVAGLVIKENHTGENDRVITILTKEYGLLRAFATGARKIKSKTGAGTQLLCYSEFGLLKGRDTYRVTEALPVAVFFSLRSDIEKLTVAQYFCELAGVLANEGEPSGEILRVLLNSLSLMADGKRTPPLIKAITELRLLCEAGFQPDLVACCGCGRFEGGRFYFHPLSAQLYCADCKAGDSALMEINLSVLSALRHICYAKTEKLYSFTLPEADIKSLGNVTERYLLAQTDHYFSTLNFYHTL